MQLQHPLVTDGLALNRLVAQSPPLDANSCYCNLLQCSHFASTCIKAEEGGEMIGFVSAYWIPNRQQELFVWQVMVAPNARGRGLGIEMLEWLVNELKPQALETSITKSNSSSWSLFKRLAARREAVFTDSGHLFDQHLHFGGEHESEALVRITPKFGAPQI